MSAPLSIEEAACSQTLEIRSAAAAAQGHQRVKIRIERTDGAVESTGLLDDRFIQRLAQRKVGNVQCIQTLRAQ